MPSPNEPGPLPVATTTYDDLAAAKSTLQLHARAQGYSIAVECKDEKRGRAAFVCSKSEKYRATGKNPDMHKSKQRPNTGTMKTEYPFKIIFKRDDKYWRAVWFSIGSIMTNR
jgi:hypothetical protein